MYVSRKMINLSVLEIIIFGRANFFRIVRSDLHIFSSVGDKISVHPSSNGEILMQQAHCV